jgi:hypothetical protein
MIGSKNGFLLHHKIDESFPKFILYHCVLCLDVLSAKVLPFRHMLEMVTKIVNTIRAAAM